MLVVTLKYFALLMLGASAAYLMYLYFTRLNAQVVMFFKNKTPMMVKNYLRKRKIKKIELQISDGVDMLANCLKAGLSLQQALQLVSKDGPHPIKEEFASVIEQVKIGKNLDDALADWKKSLPLDDIKILVESILILRQTGGNLVETFSTIARTIRERQKVSGKIRVLTTQGLFQAIIIIVLPFVLMGGLYFIAGWYIEPLFSTTLGLVLILVMLSLQAIGALWLKKIMTIKV